DRSRDRFPKIAGGVTVVSTGMTRLRASSVVLCLALAACARAKGASTTSSASTGNAQPNGAPVTAPATKKVLKTFGNESAFTAWVKDALELQRKEEARARTGGMLGAPAASAAQEAPAGPAEANAAGDKDSSESITNTQHANVDEGGIVKVHGDQFVI